MNNDSKAKEIYEYVVKISDGFFAETEKERKEIIEQIKFLMEDRKMNKEIEKQRNVITEKLQTEFKPFDVGLIWHEINELIELEKKAEMECNQ